MEADRLELLRTELRARRCVTTLLGLDIERPLRSVADGYPEYAVTLVGTGTERVLKDLWLQRAVPGDPSRRSLSQLVKGVRDHIADSVVLDSLADIQRLRNRSTHDGYEVTPEDALLALRRFVTVLTWYEMNTASTGDSAEVGLLPEVLDRVRFVGGLYTAMGFGAAQRFDLSPTTAYLLFEESIGARTSYVEVLLGTSLADLVQVLATTDGSLVETDYPKTTRFVLVQRRDGGVDGLPEGSRVVTYQEFLDTIVDSTALAAQAGLRAEPRETTRFALEGEVLRLDPLNVSFEMQHIGDVAASVDQACLRDEANLLVIGAAGTGKTRLLADLAVSPVDDGRYRFFLDMADRRHGETVEDLVVRQVGHAFHVGNSRVWPVFTYLVRSGHCACFVDAIDEGVPGGALDDVVALFRDLSVLLSASSTTIMACRQSFLLDTPYVRQLMDRRALVSEQLAGRLVHEGVDPLSLPQFEVIRIAGLAGDARETPLTRLLRPEGATLLDGAVRELDLAARDADMQLDELVTVLGPLCLRSERTVELIGLVQLAVKELFDGPPSATTCRLSRVLVPVDRDRLCFRHQILREALAALYLNQRPTPQAELHGVKVSDQCRAFLTEVGTATGPARGDGHCPPGNYLIGPPGDVRIHVLTSSYRMATTPVSVTRYRSFLRAVETGSVPRHAATPSDASLLPLFKKLRQPQYFTAQEFGEDPAICISWWGAWAYAAWQGTRLPTSIEWEIAARGTDGRLFPWGDDAEVDAVNCADHWAGTVLPTWDDWKRAHDRGELLQGRPTPPGTLRRNVSPAGCVDMSGNVWEWTSTILPGGDTAAIAGGAYDNPIRAVRCSSRGGYRLGGRSNVVGFRTLEA